MNDTILWLNLPERTSSTEHGLYRTISNISQWIDRIAKKKAGEQARLFFSVLVEVNALDIPVQERLEFLQAIHPKLTQLVDDLSKKYSGLGLPLGEEKSKYVELINAFWAEMTIAYKIIIDDLSHVNFVSSLFKNKELVLSLSMILYYLNRQVFYSYKLYSGCHNDVWRDIHQVYQFSVKKNLQNKSWHDSFIPALSIEEQYKKIILFSTANPYQLSMEEMDNLWQILDSLSRYIKLSSDIEKIKEKHLPFLIIPYSDRAPFPIHLNYFQLNDSDKLTDTFWGVDTEKLITFLNKKSNKINMSSYLIKRLKSVWEGANKRVAHRKDLLEPVAISMGLTSVSQFLSQIEIESKVLKLESKEQPLLNSSASKHPIFQAYLLDESKKGFRVKLLLAEEQKVLPTINEVVAIKLSDDSIKVGYLRWIRENAEGYVELGIEHLSSMAEPVQLKMKNLVSQNYETEQNDQLKILDSFVYPGSKTEHYKPIIFTHSFIERFTNQNIQNIQLIHKTGTIDITLTEKVGEILGYSLFLFEKRDLKNLNHKMTQSEKAAQFDSMWKEI